MYGMSEHHFLGRLTEDPLLRKGADSSSYCYFSIAINQRPRPAKDGAEKKEPAPEYRDLSGHGMVAEIICNHAKKGDIIDCWCSMSVKKTERVKDGTTFVYQNPTFKVLPMRFELIDMTPHAPGDRQSTDEQSPTCEHEPYDSAQPPIEGPEDEMELTEEEQGVSGQLPF